MKRFIITIIDHQIFGPLFIPCTAFQENQFLNDIKRIHSDDKEIVDIILSEAEKRVIEISKAYSDQELVARFATRGETLISFLASVEDTFTEQHIRPFIERKMEDMFLIIKEYNLPVYSYDRNASLYVSEAVYAIPEPAEVLFKFVRQDENILYRQLISINGKQFRLSEYNPRVIIRSSCKLIADGKLIWFSEPIEDKKLIPFFLKDEVIIPSRVEKTWFEKFLVGTIQRFPVEAEGFDIEEVTGIPVLILHLENSWQGSTVIRLMFRYNESRIYPTSKSESITKLIDKGKRYNVLKLHRDYEREAKLLKSIEETGLKKHDNNQYILVGDDFNKKNHGVPDYVEWLTANSDRLEELGVVISQEYFGNRYFIGKYNLTFHYDRSLDWFDLQIIISIGEFRIPFVLFRKHILSQTRDFMLPDGTFFIIPAQWYSRFENLFQFGRVSGDKLRIASHHAVLLRDEITQPASVRKRVLQLTSTKYKPVDPPAKLKAVMRSYQIDGFRWMLHLRDNNLNGCLADDMGLGKTVQTIALLCAEAPEALKPLIISDRPAGGQLSLWESFKTPSDTDRVENRPVNTSLLVMPTTLIYNWKSELRRFAPHLKVLVYAGTRRRSMLANLMKADVVLTSYGIARVDAEIIKDFNFNYLILDESQVIKNPSSKTYRALLTLTSRHRLVLSGTPIENSLLDLYAQMHFLNRDMLGTMQFFRRTFMASIMQKLNSDQSKAAQDKLHELISPFIMRRTKDEVAKELPPKTEQILLCRMTPEQERIYDEEKSKIRNYLMTEIQNSSIAKSSTLIISALSRLRQIACHPAMVNPESIAGSGKLETIVRNINVLVEEQHKILVISSYVKHLRLIGSWLDSERITYVTLTGKTANPQETIDRFKTRKNISVMLMTLKKGGYGLNLTEADYVLITDPWWNPAAQQQGMDRVHRIGQDKPVFVYKFITIGTVEEKILQLQREKKRIADTIISVNNPLSYLTPEGLSYLLDSGPT